MTTIHDNDEMGLSILDAAARLFEEQGVKKTTLEDIAKRAGVGLEDIKSLFHTKTALALKLQTHALQELSRQYLVEMPDASLEEMVEFIMRTRLRYAESHVEQTMLFFRKAFNGVQPWSQMLDQTIWQLSVEFASLIEKRVQAGEFRKDMDINTAVRALTSFYLTGITLMGLRADNFSADEVWAFIEPQVHMLLEGLRA
ncbi:TetR/AcrR family transcriptional regulator [Pseudodesulfovibrio sp. zrk46]|uniref:TetR/AcrR family transcriptional regulator n=1 Tax=Pseudodesulfovibrio sp. zrk46 TaxID=2725288 RepID=UPI001449EC95|nr:TetR/AcrR family transcriptional regulator [Pseudodesulfovibrio sp. zrk46]QJB56023.1 TetR/AcrR family transcriptional regulator [Pseudodesulfovibrio sp. zrk46]